MQRVLTRRPRLRGWGRIAAGIVREIERAIHECGFGFGCEPSKTMRGISFVIVGAAKDPTL